MNKKPIYVATSGKCERDRIGKWDCDFMTTRGIERHKISIFNLHGCNGVDAFLSDDIIKIDGRGSPFEVFIERGELSVESTEQYPCE